ncbi:hypothetical protein ECANGB1_2161 [Enterospora canceri]|uniref:Uncharacterized protein n=1 Tax=Enterospora canceri TaxID=1081671 RepID=A0A1Y1S4Y2_9MICR|nr:hypothetical protein ECANGB1_2161 [Enterospora canceri]
MLIRNLLLRLLTNGPAIWLLLLLLSVRTALKYAKVRSLDCKVAYEQKDAKMETRLFVFVLVLSHLMPLLSDYAKISLETLVQRDCYVASYDFALKSQPGATTEIGQNLHAQCSRFAKSIRLVFVAIGYYAPIKAICFWFNQRQIRRQMAGHFSPISGWIGRVEAARPLRQAERDGGGLVAAPPLSGRKRHRRCRP